MPSFVFVIIGILAIAALVGIYKLLTNYQSIQQKWFEEYSDSYFSTGKLPIIVSAIYGIAFIGACYLDNSKGSGFVGLMIVLGIILLTALVFHSAFYCNADNSLFAKKVGFDLLVCASAFVAGIVCSILILIALAIWLLMALLSGAASGAASSNKITVKKNSGDIIDSFFSEKKQLTRSLDGSYHDSWGNSYERDGDNFYKK